MRLVSKPVLCNYYVTYRCNASCGFCDIWERPSPYVTLEDAIANLVDLKRLGVKVIDFTGGEPLLHQSIDQLLFEAKKLGFITTLTTNGLLYPKWAERLKGKVDMLHFSLDSANAIDHDNGRGVKCFDKVQESIKIALELGERPDILFTVKPENCHEAAIVYEQISYPNGLMLILNPIFEYGGISINQGLTHKQLENLRTLSHKPKVYLNDAFVKLRLAGGNSTNNPVCKAATSTIVISPFNKLLLPCYHLGMKEFEINRNLFDTWQSQEVQQLAQLEGRLPGCEGCTINCYMQPSFAVNMDRYWLAALPSTIKYNLSKGTWKRLVTAS